VPAALAKAGSAYKVSAPWSEVGAHSVAVMLHGAHVAGSPFSVHAITQVSLTVMVLTYALWLWTLHGAYNQLSAWLLLTTIFCMVVATYLLAMPISEPCAGTIPAES